MTQWSVTTYPRATEPRHSTDPFPTYDDARTAFDVACRLASHRGGMIVLMREQTMIARFVKVE